MSSIRFNGTIRSLLCQTATTVTNRFVQTIGILILVSVNGSASEPIKLEGFTEPYRDIQVGSPDTSVISEMWADEGETVRRGQKLVQLDDKVLRAAVDVARKAAVSRGELEAAEHALAAAERRWTQTCELHGRGHATEQEQMTAKVQRDEAAARVKAYVELLERRKLELAQAELQLERLTIKSPIDGQVVGRLKDVGQVVSPADPLLVRVVQLDPLRIVAGGPAAQVQLIRVGMRLPVTIDEQRYEADVEYVAPVVDAQSGMRVIKLRLPNPGQRISGGVAATVELVPVQRPVSREQQLRQTLRDFPFLDQR